MAMNIEEKWPVPMRAIGAQNLLTMPGGVTLCGYLHKKGGSQWKIKKWPLRYVIIHRGCLYYFKSSTAASPQGAFSLNGYNRVMRSTEETTSSNVFPFKIIHVNKKHRTWFFSAACEEERKMWMMSLRKEIDRYHEKADSQGNLSICSDTESFYGSIESPVEINYNLTEPETGDYAEDDEDDEDDYLRPDGLQESPRPEEDFHPVQPTRKSMKSVPPLPSLVQKSPPPLPPAVQKPSLGLAAGKEDSRDCLPQPLPDAFCRLASGCPTPLPAHSKPTFAKAEPRQKLVEAPNAGVKSKGNFALDLNKHLQQAIGNREAFNGQSLQSPLQKGTTAGLPPVPLHKGSSSGIPPVHSHKGSGTPPPPSNKSSSGGTPLISSHKGSGDGPSLSPSHKGPPPIPPTKRSTGGPPPLPVNKGSGPPPVPVNKGSGPPPVPVNKGSGPPPVPVNKGSGPPPVPFHKGSAPPPVPVNKGSGPPPLPVNKGSGPPPVPVNKGSAPPPVPVNKPTLSQIPSQTEEIKPKLYKPELLQKTACKFPTPPPASVKPKTEKHNTLPLHRSSPDGQSFRSVPTEKPLPRPRSQSQPAELIHQSDDDDDYEDVQLPASVFINTTESNDVERLFISTSPDNKPQHGLYGIRNSSKSGKVLVVWDDTEKKVRNYRIFEKESQLYLEAEIKFMNLTSMVEYYYVNLLPTHENLYLKVPYGSWKMSSYHHISSGVHKGDIC
ncbi:SH3 domain-binding protein 2 [Hypanus sabinus]|uniref:SH3 domain-binding protein 2 n=1 Tax=Hypanus sabinus TaxID=79690 RepID=UPI0028C45C19|nr:SH3 domain-binding protein 2 [Hypanus sabinus]